MASNKKRFKEFNDEVLINNFMRDTGGKFKGDAFDAISSWANKKFPNDDKVQVVLNRSSFHRKLKQKFNEVKCIRERVEQHFHNNPRLFLEFSVQDVVHKVLDSVVERIVNDEKILTRIVDKTITGLKGKAITLKLEKKAPVKEAKPADVLSGAVRNFITTKDPWTMAQIIKKHLKPEEIKQLKAAL